MTEPTWTTGEPEAARSVTVTERRCLHPRKDRRDTEQGVRCTRCGRDIRPDAMRRGRLSSQAGKAAERRVAKLLGGQRVGQFGGPDDVTVGDLFTVQVKAGGWFVQRYWAELAKLPRSGGRTPLLVVTDRPKPGIHARRYVVVAMEDWIALHGEKP